MSSKRNETLRIELETGIYKEVAEFCRETNTNENELMTELVQCFLKDGKQMLDTMRKGYIEMAHINLEICNEFERCEAEATSLI